MFFFFQVKNFIFIRHSMLHGLYAPGRDYSWLISSLTGLIKLRIVRLVNKIHKDSLGHALYCEIHIHSLRFKNSHLSKRFYPCHIRVPRREAGCWEFTVFSGLSSTDDISDRNVPHQEIHGFCPLVSPILHK